MTSKVLYLGGLRTQSTHIGSGNTFITDAPLDNNGKGEAFSPTDTVATALASCMLTVMGIKASSMEMDLLNSTAEVTKHMSANPRRINKIEVVLKLPKIFPQKERIILENTARTCPVLQSLHSDIAKEIQFQWEL